MLRTFLSLLTTSLVRMDSCSDPCSDLNVAVVRLARRHRYRAGQLLGRLGLHPGQERLLRALAEMGELSQAQLAVTLEIEPPTVHRSLLSLERAGLVQRSPSPRDGRITLVSLTPTGRETQHEVAADWARLARETASGFTAGEQATLVHLLDRASANLADPGVRDC